MPLITFSKLRHFTHFFEFVVIRRMTFIQYILLTVVNTYKDTHKDTIDRVLRQLAANQRMLSKLFESLLK